MFWGKKKEQRACDNVYTAIDNELKRLHKLLDVHSRVGDNKSNVQTLYKRINEIQDALLEALKSQPSHDEAIRDLQEAFADLALTGGLDCKE